MPEKVVNNSLRIILRMCNPTSTAILTKRLDLPATYELGDSYPNPFNPTTSIAFQVPAHSSVSIVVYDMLGQKIRDLVQEDFEPGAYKTEWHGLDNRGKTAATGMCLIHMKSGSYVETKKCLLLR